MAMIEEELKLAKQAKAAIKRKPKTETIEIFDISKPTIERSVEYYIPRIK